MTSTAILIPARYHSNRFPGKPLCDLGGTTMIQRVYDICVKTGYDTYVLTDDMSIAHLFNDNSCRVETADYKNGTERCVGAIPLLKKYDRYINVQGDMPDVTTDMIYKVNDHLKHWNITTAFTDMPEEMRNDPNSVKMTRAGDKALWFGRGMTGYGEWHLGIYGYRRNALQLYSTYQVELEEQIEKLEQLRWLKAGWDIGCVHVDFNGIEINTPEDMEKWNKR
tara:strand:+ start:149 stop:817 length:669 start_codon:yes stop_codon:yes gene_type:complete